VAEPERPLARRFVWDRTGAKPQTHLRYRQAKATKCGGMGGEKSERLIVPSKRGNLFRGNPGEGRGRRVTEPWSGTQGRASDLRDWSP